MLVLKSGVQQEPRKGGGTNWRTQKEGKRGDDQKTSVSMGSGGLHRCGSINSKEVDHDPVLPFKQTLQVKRQIKNETALTTTEKKRDYLARPVWSRSRLQHRIPVIRKREAFKDRLVRGEVEKRSILSLLHH